MLPIVFIQEVNLFRMTFFKYAEIADFITPKSYLITIFTMKVVK